MTKKQRVFAPEEGTSVTRLGNIACITNAGRRFWETGSRKLDEHVTLYGRAVDYARRGSLLEACWEINCIFWLVFDYFDIFLCRNVTILLSSLLLRVIVAMLASAIFVHRILYCQVYSQEKIRDKQGSTWWR